MIQLKFDFSEALEFVSREDIFCYQEEINRHYESIENKTGKGNDFLGWTDLPDTVNASMINKIKSVANQLCEKSEVVVVVGIGGSYLGARAVIESLSHQFQHLKGDKPFILFAGNNLSEDYLSDLIDILDQKEYSLVVISKSGTTTEPAIAFRILKNHLESKYGQQEARKRIVAITDASKGALKQLATGEGYETFEVPDDVGGRYSVLTPVGLLPIAIAGYDIGNLLKGAGEMKNYLAQSFDIENNIVSAYSATRNALFKKGFTTEIMVYYEPRLFYLTEWWKQLFGESEGKENKGIFPAGAGFTTDLHSMGQYIQEGLRNLFETIISVKKPSGSLTVPADEANLDKLNYLSGKRLQEVNLVAEAGTRLAHIDGGVPNLTVSIPEINESTLGELIYFYEMACAMSGYILGVNPFDQPGVEAYKKNMFALLGKPGFEAQTREIRKRL